MAELIDKGVIYNKVAELEELARNRVLDTSSNSPCYMRYVSQLNERTTLKHLIADTEATTEAEIKEKVIDEAIEKFLEHDCVCVEWNNGLSKEKLVDDVLRQVMGQVVITLERMKVE